VTLKELGVRRLLATTAVTPKYDHLNRDNNNNNNNNNNNPNNTDADSTPTQGIYSLEPKELLQSEIFTRSNNNNNGVEEEYNADINDVFSMMLKLNNNVRH